MFIRLEDYLFICQTELLHFTATENYLLMLTPETRIDNKLELFLDDPNALIPGIGNIALDQVYNIIIS